MTERGDVGPVLGHQLERRDGPAGDVNYHAGPSGLGKLGHDTMSVADSFGHVSLTDQADCLVEADLRADVGPHHDEVSNTISGTVYGSAVQARDVHGGITFNDPGRSRRTEADAS